MTNLENFTWHNFYWYIKDIKYTIGHINVPCGDIGLRPKHLTVKQPSIARLALLKYRNDLKI